MAAKPVQIKLDSKMFTKAQSFAEHEGFRSVASMAYYAFVQFINDLEEEKIGTWTPTEEEKSMIKASEEDIKAGRVYKLDPNNISAIFED